MTPLREKRNAMPMLLMHWRTSGSLTNIWYELFTNTRTGEKPFSRPFPIKLNLLVTAD